MEKGLYIDVKNYEVTCSGMWILKKCEAVRRRLKFEKRLPGVTTEWLQE